MNCVPTCMYVPGFTFTTEILDAIWTLNSSNLVVTIISKVMGYMLGLRQLLLWLK